jgi:dipeptidyl-peptidase-4
MKLYRIALLLFLSAITSATQAQKSELSLEDIWANRQFFASGLPEVRAMKDGKHFSELVNSATGTYIVKNELSSGKTVDTLYKPDAIMLDGKPVAVADYQLSDDETMILLSTEIEPIYRHSTKANNYVYTIADRSFLAVSPNGKQMYATISPDGKMVAFVRDNNLFVKDLNKNAEKQITTDGKKNEIINGATDWVYEEEFSFDQGYQWSPDGSHIAYYRFDESKVKEFNLTYYGQLYPKEELYKYPKAGEENSKVEIYIYNLASGKPVKADVNKETDQYIPRIKWTNDASKLCVMRMNRLQNKLELYLCDATTGSSILFFTEENAAYLEVGDDLTFLSNKKEFIWTSTQDGYNHIYLYDMNGKLKRKITSGKWDVTSFYGFDEKNGIVYYQAAIKSPMEKGVFSSTLSGKQREMNPAAGTNSAVFTKGFQYYFITNSRLNMPPVVTLYNTAGKKVRTIKDNAPVMEAMGKFNLSTPEFFNFQTTENISLNGWMIKPAGFDSSKKYPVIQYMYGGPNSQTVKDEWAGPNFFWFQLLAQKGYLIVSVDNRGTGARGEAFNKCIYKQLGHLETIDQIEVAKWLGKQSYVDASRIGAWGWSYGGYMTSLLMTKGADFFKAAIAVAPVTNWKYYDTIYTERYLQTPQLNPKGYEDNSPINYTNLMKGNYLLVHGTADDNVHMQNAMEMADALVKDKKQFDSFFYPNKAHGIGGVRLHLYQMMTDWFGENL